MYVNVKVHNPALRVSHSAMSYVGPVVDAVHDYCDATSMSAVTLTCFCTCRECRSIARISPISDIPRSFRSSCKTWHKQSNMCFSDRAPRTTRKQLDGERCCWTKLYVYWHLFELRFEWISSTTRVDEVKARLLIQKLVGHVNTQPSVYCEVFSSPGVRST